MDDSSSVIGIINFASKQNFRLKTVRPSGKRKAVPASDAGCLTALKLFSPPESPMHRSHADYGHDEASVEQDSTSSDWDRLRNVHAVPHVARVIMADLAQLRMDLLQELELIQRRLAKMLDES